LKSIPRLPRGGARDERGRKVRGIQDRQSPLIKDQKTSGPVLLRRRKIKALQKKRGTKKKKRQRIRKRFYWKKA